ncbi:MAG: hypothetical protein ABJC10_07115 [Acidobacteriota bacterium]
MLRLFLGLGVGVVLAVDSLWFIGVGHGTYVPMAFTASVIALINNLGAIPALILGPVLWAGYYLLIPKIQTRRLCILVVGAILSSHVLAGMWLANEDSAFTRAMNEQRRELAIFGLLLALAMFGLLYLAVRSKTD